MKKFKVAVFLCLLLGPTMALAFSQDDFAPVVGPNGDQVYTPVVPCRFVDGINAADRVSSVANGTTARYYRVRGSTSSDFVSQGAAATAPNGCGIPLAATAIMVNLTVANPDGDGDLKADPADALAPSSTSALNYTFGGARGKNLANAVVAKLCDLTLSACASGATPTSPTRDLLVTFHAGPAAAVSTFFVADVLGYFAPATTVASLTCSTGQVLKWSGSVWTCGTDSDTNSGGTVSSVSAGSGLSGGTITSSGTIAVATGGITSAMIANGAVGSAQVNTAQVQTRVSGACSVGSSVRTVNSDGTVVCQGAEVTAGASVLSRPNDTTLIAAGYTEEPGLSLDFWKLTSTTNAPLSAYEHTAVWTGTKMIVWGGVANSAFRNTGGQFDPATNSWTATTTTNAPAGRALHTAVWTGTRMVVWGGFEAGGTPVNSGGLYDPITNLWEPAGTAATFAPTIRGQHSAVWTGTRMIVWGGIAFGPAALNTGGVYDPGANSWTPTSTSSAPPVTRLHGAVWTGTRMIVWGGHDGTSLVITGGQYDPNANSGAGAWVPTSTLANVPAGRQLFTLLWTGSSMLVWGGQGAGAAQLDNGALYNPTTDVWTPMSTIGAASGRHAQAGVWTGSKMIVWGGNTGGAGVALDTGAYYDPVTDIWTGPTSLTNVPTARLEHTMVWTGTQAIVWGGRALSAATVYNTGGQLRLLSVYLKN